MSSFAPGDIVRVRGRRAPGTQLWRVARRDYWKGDHEQAYKLVSAHVRMASGRDQRTRYAYESDLILVSPVRNGRAA